jgi:hypothetical protein
LDTITGYCLGVSDPDIEGVSLYIHRPFFQPHSLKTLLDKSMPSTLAKGFLVAASVSWWIGLVVADEEKKPSPAELKAELEAEDENSDYRHATQLVPGNPVESTFTS